MGASKPPLRVFVSAVDASWHPKLNICELLGLSWFVGNFDLAKSWRIEGTAIYLRFEDYSDSLIC